MSDAESILAGEDYHYLLVRSILHTLVRRQRDRLISIRTAHRALLKNELKVKSDFVREIFLSLKLEKDYEGEDGQKERYRIPRRLSNA